MDEAVSRAARHTIVGKYLTEVSLFAKELCPEAKVEATTERYEDEDGHVRLYPPAGVRRAPAPRPPQLPEAERRQCTVLLGSL